MRPFLLLGLVALIISAVWLAFGRSSASAAAGGLAPSAAEIGSEARATLRFVSGPHDATVSVVRNGTQLHSIEFVPGITTTLSLPAGRVTLRLVAGRSPPIEREYVVEAGTTPEFTFDGAWR